MAAVDGHGRQQQQFGRGVQYQWRCRDCRWEEPGFARGEYGDCDCDCDGHAGRGREKEERLESGGGVGDQCLAEDGEQESGTEQESGAQQCEERVEGGWCWAGFGGRDERGIEGMGLARLLVCLLAGLLACSWMG